MRIVLASKSPRRKDILDNIGLKFDIVESDFLEENDSTLSPEELVMHLAYKKAEAVAQRINGEAIVIGADTIVVNDNAIMGKPKNFEDSFDMLTKLSGNYHYVYSGICVIDTAAGKFTTDFEKTKVKIKKLTDEEIVYYINTGEPADKAGSYAIQGIGSLIVEYIEGCYFNVVGMPVYKLSNILNEYGINLLKTRSNI